MKKRILALLLAVVMIAGMIPTIAAVNPMPAMVIRPDTARATYTFYVGEEVVDTQIVKNNEKLTEPAAPDGEGKFLGWYVEGEHTPLNFTEAVTVTATTEVKVFAHFDEVQYVLFMDENKERVVDCKTLRKGDTVRTSDVTYPVGAGQSVTRWNNFDGVAVDEVTYGDGIDVLYAVVENGHWLTFDTNGGSYIAPQFFTGIPTQPTPPTKPGYTFSGWYLDEECMHPADFSEITGTCTVHADWIPEGNVQYTVLHMQENADDDGYSTKDIETKSGQAGFHTDAKAMSYQGFTAQTITQQTIAGDGTTIVTVKYKRNVYTVKFYTDRYGRNEDVSKRITAKYGANISKQWPGGSWFVKKAPDWDKTAQGNIDTMPLGGQNFYGQQSGTTAKAGYYLEVLPGETGTVVGGKTYKLDHTDSAPYGVYVSKEDRYPITGFMCNERLSAKNDDWYDGAKFYYDRSSYNLIFISGGSKVNTASVRYGASISGYASYAPSTPPAGMDGYVFAGWYDNEKGAGDAYDFTGKTMPAQNITLHAKWVAPVHTVTFWKDVTATTALKTIDNIPHGDKIMAEDAPAVTVGDGEEFYGWTLRNGTPFNFDTKITEDYNLYAKVGSEKGYKLTYSVNGDETLVKDDYHYTKNTPAVVKNYTPADTDKVFLGWDTSDAGTTVVYKPGATIKMTDDTTLYAVFGPKTGTVSLTYHSNDGTGKTQTVDDIANNGLITVSDYAGLTQLPARTGYNFLGWSTTATGSVEYKANDSAVIDNIGSNDLYAVWQINSYDYTVEYYIDGTKDDSLTETASAEFGTVINSYPDKCPTGYKFEKHENIPLTIGTGSNVIKVYYVKNTFVLRIQYFYDDGSEAAEDHVEYLEEGKPYSVTSPTIDGYTPDFAVVSGEMPGCARTVPVTYTKRTDLSYTVNYYWNGTTEKVAESKTVNEQTFNASVTESPIEVDGYTAVSKDSQTRTIGTENNVIDFYYYKNVTLTANSGSEVYNGQTQTLTGYTSAPEGVTFENVTASGSGTNVGEYDVTFSENPVGTTSKDAKYIVTEANPGKLTITPLKVTVTGKSDTVKYTGSLQKLDTYTVAPALPTGHTLSGLSYLAQGTTVGNYDGAFSGTAKITDKDGNDVTSNYEITTERGKLTIVADDAEIIVKITGKTRTETYNGSEQTVTGFTTDVGSKPITVTLKSGSKAEAKGTDAGEYKMGLTANDFEATSDNYSNIKI